MKRKRCLGALVALAALGACRPTPPATQAAPPGPPDPPVDLVEAVQDARKLRFRQRPRLVRTTAEDIAARHLTASRAEWPPERVEKARRVFAALGFRWLPDHPLPEALAGLRAEQDGCFHEESTGTIYYGDVQTSAGRRKLATVLARALVAQWWPVPAEENADAALAREATRQGDALTVALIQSFDDPWQTAAEADAPAPVPFHATPPFFRERTLFPWLTGLNWAAALGAQEDPGRLDIVHGAPPRSTAEILHPGEVPPPEVVTLPPLGAEPGESGTLGEAGVLTLLKTQLTRDAAVTAADGWRGDRFGVLGTALAWSTLWTSEADAGEFLRATAEFLVKRHVLTAKLPAAGVTDWDATGPERAVRLRQRGPAVFVATADAPDEAARLLAALLEEK